MPELYIVKDWMGNILFHGKTFPSFEDGWAYVYAHVDTSEDEHTYDDYYVDPVAAE